MGTQGPEILIYDAAPRRLERTLRGGGGRRAGGYALVFAAGGRTLISAGAASSRQAFDRNVRFWDVRGGRIRASVGPAVAVAISDRGHLAVVNTMQDPSTDNAWGQILGRPRPENRVIPLDESEERRRRLQSTPFCGLLTPRKRWAFHRAEPPALEKETRA